MTSQTKDKFLVADLCMLAHYYGVSVEALTLRLEDLKLIPTGVGVDQGGFKVREAQAQLGLGKIPSQDSQLPIRYQNLAVLAFDQGLITEGQFSHYLRADRLSARNIAENLRRYRSQASGINSEIELDLTEPINI
jgi:Zn-dependent peptidase ImmA (M78 family)